MSDNGRYYGQPILPRCNLPMRQKGVSLVAAIFILVVLAALGSYMVSISGTQHYTTLHALQGAKAYHAARSGIEWGVDQVAVSCLSTSFNIDDFSVAVTCHDEGTYNEGGNEFRVFTISALAQAGIPGNPSYAARQIQASIVIAE